ncbi:hypothetical protein EV426DRAFT_711622 [Tirmania nivea]|nr:hypothetical protein EV426DRAFT_711622 [Tirmania nivea]
MVTGIELAGVILATFPIIISSLDAYENGFQTMKEWSRFRKEYLVFMTALGKQKLFFRQNITALLDPIIKSEDHMLRLLEDPGGKDWKDPELDDMLRRRLEGLDETYECYMETVSSILALLEKLKGKLRLGEGEVHWTANASASGMVRLEYEFRRLTYTLGRKKRAAILSKIEKHIDEMSRILSNSERLVPQQTKRKSPISKHFQQVRSQASSLHAALSQAWKCNCSLGHTHATKLLLERRVSASEITKSYDWKIEDSAIKFEVYFSINLEPSTSKSPNKNSSTKGHSEWCAAAITIDPNLNSDLAGIYRPSSPRSSVAVPLMSSLTKTSTKNTRPLLDECRRVCFTDTAVSSKSISFDNEVSEIIDLCSTLNQNPLSQQNIGYLRDQRLDKLHTVTLGANSQLPSGTYKIISLDSLLGKGKGRNPNLSSALTRRRTRLEVVVILATSLLQLYPGPWLGERWGKQDVFFFQSADGTIHTHLPFLLSQFQSSTTLQSSSKIDGILANPQSRGGGPSPPLLSLGILILELWFNQSIESLRFRNDYLGKGGKATEYTDYNTAQKWLEQTMDEAGPDLHDPTRRCIYCAFGASSQNLEDDELRKAVCDGVVAPLERLLQRFEEV